MLAAMDTEAVRSFVRAAELGQLRHAADELGVTQQAVSKRIAALGAHSTSGCSPAPPEGSS
ncbi:hypothetical protein STENM36S_00841 [Streptomyces tendae]